MALNIPVESTLLSPETFGILPKGMVLQSGSYIIHELLGRGGFGITYLGEDIKLQRQVAIKEFFPAGATRHGMNVIPPSTFTVTDYDAAKRRFLQEAQLLARIQHRDIVDVFEVFEEYNTVYMVMEYLQGRTLFKFLEDNNGPLSESSIISIARPIAHALDWIHSMHLLHRDIKPDNIILTSIDGEIRPVLIDFGAAREFIHDKTQRQSVVLTPGYAPLEQYGEMAQRGPYTDIYAFAATVYHLATGFPPTASIERAVNIPLVPPLKLNPSLSSHFSRALLHGLEMETKRRPVTATEFVEALASSLQTRPERQMRQPVIKPARMHSDAAPFVPSTNTTISPNPQRAQLESLLHQLEIVRPITTTHIHCPICRETTMVEPSKMIGAIRCPVCRSAGLQERIPSGAQSLCPNCHRGQLEKIDIHGLIPCPVCHSGRVHLYMKRYLLVFFDMRARCDRCPADFNYHYWNKTLTLDDAPIDSGNLKGQTKSKEEWAKISKRSGEAFRCNQCAAEWDKVGDDRYQFIALEGDSAKVPPEYYGVTRSEVEWVKCAYHVLEHEGTHFCPNCDAQLDGNTATLILLDTPQNAAYFSARQSLPTTTLSVWKWRALAAGMQNPPAHGAICPACTAQLNNVGDDSYRLVVYNYSFDPFGIGMRYKNQSLPRSDWQRIAASIPTQSEEIQIRNQVATLSWKGLLSGEFTQSDAERLYPAQRSNNERVVISLHVEQYKSTQKGWTRQD